LAALINEAITVVIEPIPTALISGDPTVWISVIAVLCGADPVLIFIRAEADPSILKTLKEGLKAALSLRAVIVLKAELGTAPIEADEAIGAAQHRRGRLTVVA
jgi:hypothetical protein